MPCWSIHLGVCKEVNKEFNYDKDLIYFGAILPDLLNRDYSHYYDDHVIDFDKFLNEYKDNLNNPIIIGYYIHLLTDYFYNRYVHQNSFIFENNKIKGIKLLDGKIINSDNYKYCRDFKQDDFKNFGSFLLSTNELEFPNDLDKIYKNIFKLNIKLDKNIISNKIDYFKSDDFYKYNTFNGYKLFDKETYDKLYKDCIDFVITNIKKINKRC